MFGRLDFNFYAKLGKFFRCNRPDGCDLRTAGFYEIDRNLFKKARCREWAGKRNPVDVFFSEHFGKYFQIAQVLLVGINRNVIDRCAGGFEQLRQVIRGD